ncbi:hypothetical protein [Streptomyces sp. AC602_WCS936]|uniref:hypothetical protein n=1 Tax=Streptomyces sp. AC602_WCS936 TaxID=2823685 RepID=UPI001C26BA72|nr:hypothetical protein [Streptomyces sp. AC602_WCS936]
MPGNAAETKTCWDSGLAAHCDGVTVLGDGDGAYANTGLIVPHHKCPVPPMLKGEEEDNAQAPQGPRPPRV